jgi:hypothetical protein
MRRPTSCGTFCTFPAKAGPGGLPGPPTRLLRATFVRHGETELNAKKLVQGGNADPSLAESGRAQARELAKTLKKGDYDVIVCSDQRRAV